MTLRDDHYRLIRDTVEPEARNQRVRFTVGRFGSGGDSR